MAYRNYSVANGFTVDPSGNGDFTTITLALAAATSGKDIFIRPGTYTENLTLKSGVNLVGFSGDDGGTVKIIGNMSITSGVCQISNIFLQTNGNYILSATGSSALNVKLNNCYLNCSNFSGIFFTSSSAASVISINEGGGDLGTTAITYHTSSSPGNITYTNFFGLNSGGSTQQNLNIAGSITLFYSYFTTPFAATTTGNIFCYYTYILSSSATIPAISVTGTGSPSISDSILLAIGGAAAANFGSGVTADLARSTVSSTNTNAVTGAGTLVYGDITFASGGSTQFQNTLTLALVGETPSNAASGALLASTGTNTSPAYTLTPSVTSITLGGGTALANYVQGTFTPVVIGTTGAGTATYTTQAGSYTRIGNRVFYEVYLTWNTGTGTGNLQVGGFPIASTSSSAATTSAIYTTNATATATVLYFQHNNATTTGNLFYYNPSVATSGSVVYAASATTLQIFGSYMV